MDGNSPFKSPKHHRCSDQSAVIPKHATRPVHIPNIITKTDVVQIVIVDGQGDEACKPEEGREEVEG
jgi:hypothetical protein